MRDSSSAVTTIRFFAVPQRMKARPTSERVKPAGTRRIQIERQSPRNSQLPRQRTRHRRHWLIRNERRHDDAVDLPSPAFPPASTRVAPRSPQDPWRFRPPWRNAAPDARQPHHLVFRAMREGFQNFTVRSDARGNRIANSGDANRSVESAVLTEMRRVNYFAPPGSARHRRPKRDLPGQWPRCL